QPFGALPLRRQPLGTVELPPLAGEVDEVGLTSQPQAGFGKGGEIPNDYLLRIKAALGEKPPLITRPAIPLEPPASPPAISPSAFVKRMLQTCYWLDARLVAYPEFFSDTKDNKVALVAAGLSRPALKVWADVLEWKRVEHLTLKRKNLGPRHREQKK